MKPQPILRMLVLRSLGAHKLRLFLTVVAVVLGTSFVSGAFILTASLSKAFDDITSGSVAGADLIIDSTPEYPLTLDTAAEISERADVDRTEVLDSRPVIIIGPDGAPYQSGGAGSWVLPYTPPEDAVISVSEVVEGRAPSAAGEATVNSEAAETAGIEIGDTISVVDYEKRLELEVVGINELSLATGGWAGASLDTDVFRSEFSDGNSLSRLAIEGSVTQQQLQADYPDLLVVTAEEAAEAESAEIGELLAFFTYILLAFGLIALMVGTFIISNTFSMIVAQRTREFALLRAIGMSRRQLTGSVLVEAIVIGVMGSILGIGVGIGLVRAIVVGMEAFGLGFPDAGLGLDAASVIAPIGIGVLVTAFSALAPARRAGKISPVGAMRQGDQMTHQPLLVRTLIGLALLLLGAAGTLIAVFATGWNTTDRAILTGGGALAIVAAVLLLSGWIARSLFSIRPPAGRVVALLAGTNLSRNPRRTAATAFALTLGVALVAVVGILGASVKESVFGDIDEQLKAKSVVATGIISNQGIPQQAVGDIEAIDSVAGTVAMTWLPMTINGQGASTNGQNAITSVLDDDPRIALALTETSGSFDAATQSPGVGLSDTVAATFGVSIGDNVDVEVPSTGQSVSVPVLVTWEDSSAYTPMAVSNVTAEELFPDQSQWSLDTLYVVYGEDADEAATHQQVIDAVAGYGVLQVMTAEEFGLAGAEQIDQLLTMVYALLALSVVIAALGIINTLALSIAERRHEFGMLRAVGMQRSQISRMILIESVYIAVFGAVFGIITGVWLGWCFVRILADQGIDRWLIPWSQMGALVLGAVIVGILAALWPARKAALTSAMSAVE
ncbi:ABC transporter permease [Corynebacterium alimapuense]|uniref:ABC transporter permease n=1 Tax=Corynebacterium alimapuense TaxID=1576874 RepID=A0A3M8K600_9CORY|nr:FtsX-like permease family protein [Corynebacterium alimapuense]RNE48653.1 ABC transporter permease [Corynebacterium alimapuense]